MERKRYTWKTANISRETEDSVTIVFDTEGILFDYLAGQFVNVSLVINGETVSRSYSLSSSPRIDTQPSLTIKKIEGGKLSEHIFRNAEKIKKWEIEGPLGLFYLTEEIRRSDHLVFMAGGSGITPVYSMIKDLLNNSVCKLTLVYSTRGWNQAIFKRQLLDLEAQFPTRLKIHFAITGSDDPKALDRNNLHRGRLSRLVIKKLIKQNLSPHHSHYFICGPEGLIQKTEEALADLMIDKKYVHTEYFFPSKKNEQASLPNETLEVLLHFGDQTNLLEVKPQKTILETALEDKVPLTYSCKSGTCGMCAARLLKGKVHMQTNFVLTEDHIRQGFILLCQSHPLDNDVTVEIN